MYSTPDPLDCSGTLHCSFGSPNIINTDIMFGHNIFGLLMTGLLAVRSVIAQDERGLDA